MSKMKSVHTIASSVDSQSQLNTAGEEEDVGINQRFTTQEGQELLETALAEFWSKQKAEVEVIDPEDVEAFKRPAVPLARVKKIMKENEEVKMISGEAPIVFSKACELLASELAIYAWNRTDTSRRRTIKQDDILASILDNELFDFLQVYFSDIGKLQASSGAPKSEPTKS